MASPISRAATHQLADPNTASPSRHHKATMPSRSRASAGQWLKGTGSRGAPWAALRLAWGRADADGGGAVRAKSAEETGSDDPVCRRFTPTKKPGKAGLKGRLGCGLQLPTFT
ncbi:hypothetical protein LBMAG39_09220 [Cyanobium sp.]|nr:hypothetical protein LBMAG39_09220 [Cyanobium sp.]